jgi:hypothetical protein
MLVLTAFFPGQAQAESALVALAALGVPSDDVSVFPRRRALSKDVGLHATSKAAEGIAMGAVSGIVLGALIGYVAAAGALVVPVIGSVFAGPIVASLAFAGIGSGFGIVVGSIIGARFPELEARLADDAQAVGGALVTVRCTQVVARVLTQTLEQRGASFVHQSSV